MARTSAMSRLATLWPAFGTTLLVVVVTLALAGHSPGVDQTLIIALIDLIMATGLFIFVGCSGVVSFGHVSFMAIGAYVSGMFTMPNEAKAVFIPNAPGIFVHTSMGTTEGVLVGGLVAAVVAAILAAPLMRLSGIGASIGTLALLVIVHTFFFNWQPGSSGGGNLTRIPTDVTVNSAMVWAVICLLVAFAYKPTRFGLRLRAAREDEVAARSTGVGIIRERRIAFTLSAFLFGLAGGLYGHTVGSFSADDFFLPVTFFTLAMLIVGGSASILGAVVGTGLLSVVGYVFDQWTNDNPAFGITLKVPAGTTNLVVAAVLVLTLILRPQGLTGGRELALPRNVLRRRSKPGETTGEPESASGDGEPVSAADSHKVNVTPT